MSQDQQIEPTASVVVQVEREKTKRWLIVGGVFTICFCMTCWTFLKYSEIERPWWHYIIVPILPIILGWIPGALGIRRFRRYIARHHQRTVQLEQTTDPKRLTSGLNEDGTYEHD
jgi:hypothetical protein